MAEQKHALAQTFARPQTDEFLVAVIPKNKLEEIRVRLSSFENCDFVDLRIFVDLSGEDGERRPTKKGIALAVSRLPELVTAILAAETEAKRLGLLRERGS